MALILWDLGREGKLVGDGGKIGKELRGNRQKRIEYGTKKIRVRGYSLWLIYIRSVQ